MDANKLKTIIETKQKKLEKTKKSFIANHELLENYKVIDSYVIEKMTTKINSVKEQIEPLVNSSLKSIFTDEIIFEITTDIRYGKANYNVNIVNLTSGISGTTGAHGGSVTSVVSVILRILFIMLSKKPRILMLDETLNQVSEIYRPKTAEFLKRVCAELDFQISIITFDEGGLFGEFADTIVEAFLKDNETIYKKAKHGD